VPEKKDKLPLTPVVPLLIVCITILPELVGFPNPVLIDNEPPLALAPCPATTLACPPSPTDELLERPAVMVTIPPFGDVADVSCNVKRMSPPLPVVPLPTFMLISPPLPFVADPVEYEILPVEPLLAVPLVKLNSPLTPLVPAFGVLICMNAEDVGTDTPAVSESAPPDFWNEMPVSAVR
jgi:hypothetical protein